MFNEADEAPGADGNPDGLDPTEVKEFLEALFAKS